MSEPTPTPPTPRVTDADRQWIMAARDWDRQRWDYERTQVNDPKRNQLIAAQLVDHALSRFHGKVPRDAKEEKADERIAAIFNGRRPDEPGLAGL